MSTRSPLLDAVRGEVRKITSVRALLAVPVGAVLYGFVSFGPALTASPATRREVGPDALLGFTRGPGFALAVAMLLFGALAVAGEHRHGTIAASLLVVPDRRRFLTAKALAVAGTAAVTAVAVEVVVLVVGTAFMRANDLSSTAAVGDVALSASMVVLVSVLYALMGVGVATVVRDQTAAVVGALLWITVAEGAIPIVLRKAWLFRWLPGGAANAALGIADPPPDLLPAWGGVLILLGVATALVTAATATFTTRDLA